MNIFKFLIAILIFSVTIHSATIRGIDDPVILSLIKSQISNWESFSKDSISAKFKLARDKYEIKRILNSFGYFDVKIKSSFEKEKVIFDIIPNERYKFDEVLLIYKDQREYRAGLKIGQVFELINIDYDSYTDTKQLSEAKDKIADYLKKQGFAFVSTNDPKIEINKTNKKIKAIYEIVLNGKTIIDKTIINIKSKKDPKLLKPFVENRISWKNGDVFDQQKLDNLKKDVMASGIFSGISIKLTPPKFLNNDFKNSHTIITIDIEEALLRDIAAGVKYGNSEKAGVLFSWKHYNIDGKGASLSLLADVGKVSKNIRAKYEIYDLFYKKQKLNNQVFYLKEDVDSYNVSKVGIESVLWQNFGQSLAFGSGFCKEKSRTRDKIDSERIKFNAFGVPIGMNFDTTEDFLDPQKGIRCSAMLTPYFGNLTNITVFSGKASVYVPLKKNSFKNWVVFAAYSKFGSIFRNKNHKIPRDKFFFSGGANSIRGYGYQKVGPVNNRKIPLGGESIFEFGLEPRFKINDDIGLIAFWEGGNVFSTKVPNPLRKLLFGYGVGVRYYTPLGPIRVDIAFPTSRRKTIEGKKIDSLFNIYISIGQAF